MYGILNYSDIPYDVTPYGYNALYLTSYGLLCPCITYKAFYGPVRLNVISYSILRSYFTCYYLCLSYTYSVDVWFPTEGSTQSGLPYLYKCPDQFTNVDIWPVSRPLVMYKFFNAVNEIYPHNKSRQSDLALEKFWFTQCGWIWLCTTVDMGMTINNFWKLFNYGLNRDRHDKLISIR